MNDKTEQVQGYSKEILHSWKRIAQYLNRSVRTARRWEETEELPVRRHRHIKNNSVYAYIGELEKWREQREVPKTFSDSCEENIKINMVEPTFWKNITAWLN